MKFAYNVGSLYPYIRIEEPMATFTRAAGAATDPKDDYQDEVSASMQKVIGKAWADPDGVPHSAGTA